HVLHHPGVPRGLRDDLGNGLGVDPEALGDAERLAHRDRGHPRDQVVAELGDLAAPHRAHVNHVRAHGLQSRQGRLEILPGAAHHDGEGAVDGPRCSSRHRRVHEAQSALGRRGGHAPRGGGIHRGHVDAKRALPSGIDDAAVASVDAFHVGGRRQHGDDDIGARHRLGRRSGRGHAGGHRRLHRLGVEIVRGHREALLDQIDGHGKAHGADADEADACHARSPGLDRSSMPAHSSMSRATTTWYLPSLPYTTGAMLLGLALVCVAAVSWGTTGSVMSLLARDGAPSHLLVGWARMAGAAPCLLVATYVIRSGLASSERASRRVGRWTWMDRAKAALLGIAMAAYQLCYFWAVPRTGVALTALL